ncbi:MAG: hypothetical protein LM582_02725 [Desulfurococcaceae archaeon]|jgi:rRNA-processing protein FCF1|nr:hypothetical protein [Desulfurococcaceae archaeon]
MGTYKDVKENIKCIAILDTSILFLIAQNLVKLDTILATVNGCILSIPIHVLNELNKLSSKSTEKGRLAYWILNNIVNNLNIISEDIAGCRTDEADCAIIEISKKLGRIIRVVVLTADIELKKRLIENGIEVVWYRKAKNRLEPSILV